MGLWGKKPSNPQDAPKSHGRKPPDPTKVPVSKSRRTKPPAPPPHKAREKKGWFW